jgi:hypothetical protein
MDGDFARIAYRRRAGAEADCAHKISRCMCILLAFSSAGTEVSTISSCMFWCGFYYL